jgi:hypothetical protein
MYMHSITDEEIILAVKEFHATHGAWPNHKAVAESVGFGVASICRRVSRLYRAQKLVRGVAMGGKQAFVCLPYAKGAGPQKGISLGRVRDVAI